MKISLFALTVSLILFSCKKDIEQKSITANEIIGTGYVKGYLSKCIISPDPGFGPGNFSWNNTSKIPAAGVNLSVRVAKSGTNGLYPNSTVQGTDVYTGTTDANGNFNIAIKSNGSFGGVQAMLLCESFQGTIDTLLNGTTKTGRSAYYMGWSTNVQVFVGQSSVINGPFGANNATWIFNNNMIPVNDQNNGPLALNTGTATVMGFVKMEFITSSITGTNSPVLSTTNIPVPAGTKVYCRFDSDPVTYATKIYQAVTDGSGGYSFNISTIAQTGAPAGFLQNGVIWVADFIQSRDTIYRLNGNVVGTTTGKLGSWNTNTITITQNQLWNNEIRNASNFVYDATNFVPN